MLGLILSRAFKDSCWWSGRAPFRRKGAALSFPVAGLRAGGAGRGVAGQGGLRSPVQVPLPHCSSPAVVCTDSATLGSGVPCDTDLHMDTSSRRIPCASGTLRQQLMVLVALSSISRAESCFNWGVLCVAFEQTVNHPGSSRPRKLPRPSPEFRCPPISAAVLGVLCGHASCTPSLGLLLSSR